MSGPGQLALDLGHRPALGRDDFLVVPGNADAVARIDRWPEWPAPALVVHGPAGCGKSHLAGVWQARTQAVVLDPEDGPGDPPDGVTYCVIDGADTWRDDAALFHLYNRIAERRGHLLVTARRPPALWRDRLPDLMSRLRAAPSAAIAAPDDALVAAVLVKLFADRQLRVGAEIVSYLMSRMERSVDAARRLVAAADEAALAARRNITVPLIREVLSRL